MEPRGFGLSATNSSFHKQHEHCTRRHCRGRRRQRLPASWRTFPLCARVRELTFCFIGASGLLDQKHVFLGRRVGNARRRPRHPQFGRGRRSAAQVQPEGKNCSSACVSRPAAHPWRGVSHVDNYFCAPPTGAIRKSTMNLVRPDRVHTSTVKKSAATITSQCRLRNSFHVVFRLRSGAGPSHAP